jgi:hypothetical protein
LSGRLETFIYSDEQRQVALAGRDGEDAFARVFGADARTVVVLYRAGWGDQGFTAAEATAIRNRAYEHGYDFTTFIPLDVPPSVPKWLARNRLWVGTERWGWDAAAAVIESRVLEQGGSPRIEDASVVAKQLQLQRDAKHRRFTLLNDGDPVEKALSEYSRLVNAIKQVATNVGLDCQQRTNEMTVMDEQWHATVGFHREYTNSLRGSHLWVAYSKGRHGVTQHYDFDVDEDGYRLGWREKQPSPDPTGRVVVLTLADPTFITSATLADTVVKTLLKHVMGDGA